MNKKYHLILKSTLFVYFLSFSFLGFSQDKNNYVFYNLKNSSKGVKSPSYYRYDDSLYVYAIAPRLDVGLAYTKMRPIYFQLDKKTLTPVKIVDLDDNFDKSDVSIDAIWNKNMNWYITYNKKGSIYKINVDKISFDQSTTQKTNLFDVEMKRSIEFVGVKGYPNIDTTVYTIIVTMFNNSTNHAEYYVSAFDLKDFSKKWSQSFELPYEFKKADDVGNQFYINRNGEPQFLATTYYTKNKALTQKGEDGKYQNFHYVLFVMTEQGKIEEYNIKADPSLFMGGFDMSEDKRFLPLVAYYVYDEDKELKGLEVQKIDLPNKKIEYFAKLNYSPESLNKLRSENQPEQYSKWKNLVIKKVLMTEDKVYVIGEIDPAIKDYSENKGLASFGLKGNLLITCLDRDGKELWTQVIEKARVAGASLDNSIFAFIDNNKLNIVFNDNKKNYEEVQVPRILYGGSNKAFVIYEETDNGKFKSKIIIDDISKRNDFDISRISKLSNRQFIVSNNFAITFGIVNY